MGHKERRNRHNSSSCLTNCVIVTSLMSHLEALMQILEKAKTVGRVIKRIVRGTIYVVGTVVIAGLLALWAYYTYLPSTPPNARAIAVQHEFLEQAAELDHRTKLCSAMIDD